MNKTVDNLNCGAHIIVWKFFDRCVPNVVVNESHLEIPERTLAHEISFPFEMPDKISHIWSSIDVSAGWNSPIVLRRDWKSSDVSPNEAIFRSDSKSWFERA